VEGGVWRVATRLVVGFWTASKTGLGGNELGPGSL
jgi:hypothetical protein